MGFLGRWEIDDLLTFPANTHTPATGAGTDADSVPAFRIYEDETGTAILTGSMAKLDDANSVGFYSEQITLSAANGFEVGKSYTIYISAAVGGVTGTMAHTFQVEAALATAAQATDIAARLPAALVSGRIDASVGAMAADVITAAAHDESTAFPLKQADSGATALARTGADSDTLETLSDQLDAKASQSSVDDLPTNDELAAGLAAGDDATLAAIATAQTAINDIPTNAELATALAAADDAVLTAIAALNNLSPAQVNAEVDTAIADAALATAANLATVAGYIDTEILAIKTKTDLIPAAPAATGDIPTVAQILTTAMTESYPTLGATITVAQALYAIHQWLTEKGVSGTTVTTKKRDQSTTAKTYTLNSATEPTATTEAT